MPRRKKPRGYSPKARKEHPGVTISNDRGLIVLRWREVLPGGRQGKRRKEVVKDRAGRPIETRREALPHAVSKSRELQAERVALSGVDERDEHNPGATWDELVDDHAAYLVRKGRSPKTSKVYAETWAFIQPDTWPQRPEIPKRLRLKDLEGFAHLLSQRTNTNTGEPLSPHYIASILRNLKALLNHGRRRLRCVLLDSETIAEGLEPTVRGDVKPTVIPAAKLRNILKVARDQDVEREATAVFPLLAVFMLTGARRGEIERLRWSAGRPQARESWVDFDGGRIVMYSTKTGDERVVPLENRPLLGEMLRSLSYNVDIYEKPYVFGGTRPLAIARKRDTSEKRGRSLKRAFYEVRKATGADWSLKDLRSTTATHLANSRLYGSEMQSLAWELGHDEKILKRHYAGQFRLPKAQRNAATVEAALGIERVLNQWLASTMSRGKTTRLRPA